MSISWNLYFTESNSGLNMLRNASRGLDSAAGSGAGWGGGGGGDLSANVGLTTTQVVTMVISL